MSDRPTSPGGPEPAGLPSAAAQTQAQARSDAPRAAAQAQAQTQAAGRPNAKPRPKTAAQPRQKAAPGSQAEAQARARAEARKRVDAARKRSGARRLGARTQALILILGCFAASAALRAGDFVGRKIGEEAIAERAAPAPQPAQPLPPALMAGDPVASGAFATGSTPGAGSEIAELAAQTMDALGRDDMDPAMGLDLAHMPGTQPIAPAPAPVAPPSAEAAALLEALRRREAELDAYATRLDAREKELSAVSTRVEERLRQLEREREVFSGLLANIEVASQKDVEHLVAMYSRMNAKRAAAIFDTMDPGFAAGFLVRMRADKASSILAIMDPTRAYAVSLRMAGRNVKAGDPPLVGAQEPADAAAPAVE